MYRQSRVFPTDEKGALSYIVWACGPQGAHLKPHEEHRRANLNSELKIKWNSRKALWRANLGALEFGLLDIFDNIENWNSNNNESISLASLPPNRENEKTMNA